MYINRGVKKMAKKIKKEEKKFYKKSKMTPSDKYKEIRKILRGDYDNWKSFGYSGGLCMGK